MVDNDPNRDVHGHSTLKSAPEGAGTRKWWPLLLGALALLALLFLLLRGCDQDGAEVTPTAEATVATPIATPAAGTVAATPYSSAAFNRTLTGTEALPVNYTLDRVTFDSGSAVLNDDARAEITDLANALKARSTARVALRGYADPSGDAAANQALSEQRAAAVREAMIAGGVAASQITTAASGETGDSTARENRRVEISLLQR